MSKICRVVPAIVARHPEILQLPKPIKAGRKVSRDYINVKRKISCIVEEKLCGKF